MFVQYAARDHNEMQSNSAIKIKNFISPKNREDYRNKYGKIGSCK